MYNQQRHKNSDLVLTRLDEKPRLTPRQVQVIVALADDLTAKEVSGRLGISPKTVEFHIAALRERLGLRGIVGIVRYAIREGLIKA